MAVIVAVVVMFPVPVRLTICGLLAELSWNVTAPIRVPAAVGSKVT